MRPKLSWKRYEKCRYYWHNLTGKNNIPPLIFGSLSLGVRGGTLFVNFDFAGSCLKTAVSSFSLHFLSLSVFPSFSCSPVFCFPLLVFLRSSLSLIFLFPVFSLAYLLLPCSLVFATRFYCHIKMKLTVDQELPERPGGSRWSADRLPERLTEIEFTELVHIYFWKRPYNTHQPILVCWACEWCCKQEANRRLGSDV